MKVEEIVARAICKANGGNPDWSLIEFNGTKWERHWHKHRKDARAAILAMADNVTDEMLSAYEMGCEAEDENDTYTEAVRRGIAAAIRSATREG